MKKGVLDNLSLPALIGLGLGILLLILLIAFGKKIFELFFGS